jgi:16S rRNA (uracil1498-N3)-methyltransferase
MTLRLYVAEPLAAGLELALPEGAARHAQVRRLQPGDALRLFDGRGGEWSAEVARMGRRDVTVRALAHDPVEPGVGPALEIAFGMPANERMDALVEKATELGAAAIHPLRTVRSVLRLDGERAARRVAHWRSVAVAACEQCGRTRVPEVSPVAFIDDWLRDGLSPAAARLVMTPAGAPPLARLVRDRRAAARWIALSGPEGGLDSGEMAAAAAAGFEPVALGPLVLRADTAPLAWLAQMAALLER